MVDLFKILFRFFLSRMCAPYFPLMSAHLELWVWTVKPCVQVLLPCCNGPGFHRLLCNFNPMCDIALCWLVYGIAHIITCPFYSYGQCGHPLLTVNSRVPMMHSLWLVYCIYIKVLRKYFIENSVQAVFCIHVYKWSSIVYLSKVKRIAYRNLDLFGMKMVQFLGVLIFRLATVGFEAYCRHLWITTSTSSPGTF